MARTSIPDAGAEEELVDTPSGHPHDSDTAAAAGVAAAVRATIDSTCVEQYYAHAVGEHARTVRIVPFLHGTGWFPGRPAMVWGARGAVLQAAGLVWACGGLLVALLVLAPLFENGVGIINGHPQVLPGAPGSSLQTFASLAGPGLIGLTALLAQAFAVVSSLAQPFGITPTPAAIARALRRRALVLLPVILAAGIVVVAAVLGIWYAVDPSTQTRDWLGVSVSVVVALLLFTYLAWLVPVALATDVGPGRLWSHGLRILMYDRPGATLTPLLILGAVPQGVIAWLFFEAGSRWSRQYTGARYLALVALVTIAAALASCWSGSVAGRLYLARQPFAGRTDPRAVSATLPALPALMGDLSTQSPRQPRRTAVVRAGVGLVAALLPVLLVGGTQALNPTSAVAVTMSYVDYPSKAEAATLDRGLTPLPVGYGDIVMTDAGVAVLDSGDRGTGFYSPRGTSYGDAFVTFACDPTRTVCPPAAETRQYTLLAGAAITPAGAEQVAISGWATTPDTHGQTTTADMCSPYDCRGPGDGQRLDHLVLLVCNPQTCVQELQQGRAIDVGPVTNTPALDGRYRQVDSRVVALGGGRFAVLAWRPRPDYGGAHDADTQGTLTICDAQHCGTPQKLGTPQDDFALTVRNGLPVPVTYDIGTGQINALICPDATCASPTSQVLTSGYAALPTREDDARDWSSQRLWDATVRDDGGLVVSYLDPSTLQPALAWCTDTDCTSPQIRMLDAAWVAQAPVQLAPGNRGEVYYTLTDPVTGALQLGTCTLRGCAASDRTTLAYFAPHQVFTWRDPVYGPSSVSLQVDGGDRPIVAWAGSSGSSESLQMSGLMRCAHAGCAPR